MASNDTSPRQKMINLMYLVFIAMLALNVSSEVLDGFELVEEGLLRTVKSSTENNERIYGDMLSYHETNPEKSQMWYESAVKVKERSDALFNYIQDIKVRVTKHADGEDGDPEHLKHPDDLNASLEVMFERGKDDAKILKKELNEYREFISQMVTDPGIKTIIENNLSTEPSPKAKLNQQSWEESMFMRQPMAAAITLLTKMQNDVRYAEGEVLSNLLKNVDITDVRVNSMDAFVIPQSEIVMRGAPYQGRIVMAAQDTTQRPRIFLNGKQLSDDANGRFSVGTASAGSFTLTGYAEITQGDGSILRRDYTTQYTVVEPSATVAPVLMNVLYAGIENEVRVGASGAATQNVSASMTNGTLTHKSGDMWVAKPSAVGTPAVITVMAKTGDGRSQEMGRYEFRVRPLPPPTAFLTVKDKDGNQARFTGGPLSKAALSAVDNLQASIDDGILNIGFSVLRFETMTFDQLGNAMREQSDGARFSAKQKNVIRSLQRGKMLYVRNIVTKGPDGREQTLNSPIEIIIN